MKKFSSTIAMVFVVICSFASSATAAELPSLDQQVSITVREQPVQQFLKTLFSQVGVPVVVSEDIEGLMNGRFEGTAREVLDNVTQAFNVTLYFDGAVAYIYSSNEITRTMMPVSRGTAESVEKIAARMRLGDNNNRIDSSGDGGLMVTGTRRYLEQIEELSFSVQANAKSKEAAPIVYRVFYLSNAWAADTNLDVGNESVVISGVASLLKELVFDGTLPVSIVENLPSRSKNTLEGLRGRGLQSVSTDNPAAASEDVPRPSVASKPPSTQGARIVADSRLNAIIISDTADRMQAYQELIKDLDRPSQMVEIEATIIDINTDKTRELGVGWQYRRPEAELSVIGNTGGADGTISPASLVQGPGAILSTVLGGRDRFLARIQALEEQGAARVVSKPHVITLSDVEAVLGATTEFFVRLAGVEDVDLFNVPVGTTLRVTPHVFQDGGRSMIKLLVDIEDGAASSQQVDQIPVIERAKINTQAVINEGDSLLIGGLVRDSVQELESRVPLLGRIPFLGRLFRSTANNSSRVERLFMITPRTADGIGFGGVHTGRRVLPTLQGDVDDIELQARQRLSPQAQPSERAVGSESGYSIEVPQRDLPSQSPVPENHNKPATQVPEVVAEPAFQQWVAVPGSGSNVVTEILDTDEVADSQLISIPVALPAARDHVEEESNADDDGWVAIQ